MIITTNQFLNVLNNVKLILFNTFDKSKLVSFGL